MSGLEVIVDLLLEAFVMLQLTVAVLLDLVGVDGLGHLAGPQIAVIGQHLFRLDAEDKLKRVFLLLHHIHHLQVPLLFCHHVHS